jgi:long-chain acyl-CoA synthetase
VACVNRVDIRDFTGTVGFPMPSTDVSIRSLDGDVLPPGERGEICVRGPQVMAGYWRRPDETARAMTGDGFFRTGDVGVLLPDGQVKVVDRIKDMVLVSGFNVYPNEVEEVLAEHPGVIEVAVIGVPDASSGEAVAAFVVRRDPSLTAEALRDHARARLTSYKVPRRIEFRDELPKTNVGKVLRRALREEAAPRGGGARSGARVSAGSHPRWGDRPLSETIVHYRKRSARRRSTATPGVAAVAAACRRRRCRRSRHAR